MTVKSILAFQVIQKKETSFQLLTVCTFLTSTNFIYFIFKISKKKKQNHKKEIID